MKLPDLRNLNLYIKKKILALSVCAMMAVTSLPVITATTAVAILGVSNNASALSDVERSRKMHYKKAENLRKKASKARANGNDKKADRLEEKAKKIEEEAP